MRYSLASLCLALCVSIALLAAACDTGFSFGVAAGGDEQPAGVQDGAGDAQQEQEDENGDEGPNGNGDEDLGTDGGFDTDGWFDTDGGFGTDGW